MALVRYEPLPEVGALPSGGPSRQVRHQQALRGAAVAQTLASRILLGLYLAVRALLIPGEAGRLSSTPLSWDDVLPWGHARGSAVQPSNAAARAAARAWRRRAATRFLTY